MQSANIGKRCEVTRKVRIGIYYCIAALYLLPFVWIVITSIKPAPLVAARPPVWVFTPTFEHFIRLFIKLAFLENVFNSFIIASVTTGVCLVAGSLAAWSFVKYRLGKDFLPIWMLSNRFLPLVAILLPVFLFYDRLGLLDTYAGVILANLTPNLAFAIWMLRSFFAEIPPEIDDAATIDGCGDLKILWHITIPIARPAIAVTAIFVFLFSWNEFFVPLVLTQRNVTPVTVAFTAFRGQFKMDWGGMGAGVVICLVPLIVIIAIFHKQIVRGMTLGAVKG